MTTAMTGAELKVKLNGLGIPPSWFADYVGVVMRTVVRWFDGDSVPASAAEAVDKLSGQTIDEMNSIVDNAPEDMGGTIILTTYRTDDTVKGKHGKWPASWHRLLTFRVLEHFETEGRSVTVEYR